LQLRQQQVDQFHKKRQYTSLYRQISVVTGAASERGRIWPLIIFVFVWCTLVYNFIAYWTWCPNGWACVLGALDYAGGVPVHMAAGMSALAYCFMLGRRQPVTHPEQDRPHNINNIFLGTALSWFGWFGFNGASGLIASSRAVLACVVTNLAACTGGFTWCMLDYCLSKPKYKFTLFGFCMGSMAGLVCITPASGFVGPAASLVFGIGGSTCVYFGRKIKILLRIDDAFDIFAQHGVGGFVGCLLTGIFAEKYIPALDQVTIQGGWLDGHWIQFTYQLALACKNRKTTEFYICSFYSFSCGRCLEFSCYNSDSFCYEQNSWFNFTSDQGRRTARY